LADSPIVSDVRSSLTTLEAQCHELAPLVDRCEWKQLERLLSDMARVRHALSNAWEAAQAERTPEFEEEIRTRVQRVLEYRDFQLHRLEQFRDQTGARLQLISRWRTYARSVAGKRRTPSAALFTDIR
jgi:hypothetical protein